MQNYIWLMVALFIFLGLLVGGFLYFLRPSQEREGIDDLIEEIKDERAEQAVREQQR